ncbi:MAG: hypothetical protein QW231_05820, partial [Candidatus Bathyarchaeia archaeon]
TEVTTAIWKYKKEKGLALSQELGATVYAPKELEVLGEDLEAMHGIRDLRFGKPEEEKTKICELSSGVFIIE